jgi:putative sterol carrier protein
MAIHFPHEATEWVRRYREVLNSSATYAEEGAEWGVDFDGSFVFEIRPDDAYTGDPVYMYLDLVDGECTETAILEDPDEREHGFALRADFSDWKDLIEGELNPIEAILSGPFDLDGDRVKVMQWSSAGVAMTELAGEVETVFDT